MSDRVRRRVVVEGRVQGVYFRGTCADRAAAAGVAGWVRNRPDGTVEAAFEGAPAAVERMVSWCWEGPRLADVVHVDVTVEEPTGETRFVVT